MQPLAKLAHAGRFMLPQEEHDQILRVGKPQRLEDGSVGALQQIGRSVERKAALPVQAQGIVGRDRHGLFLQRVFTDRTPSILPLVALGYGTTLCAPATHRKRGWTEKS